MQGQTAARLTLWIVGHRAAWRVQPFVRVRDAAGVPVVTLRDNRATCGTIMERLGVPISVISQWLGHYDPAFTMSVYVRPTRENMTEAARTLASVYDAEAAS